MIKWGARRMTNFQITRCSYVFTSVPKTHGWFYSEPIGRKCYSKNTPADNLIPFLKVNGVHTRAFNVVANLAIFLEEDIFKGFIGR